MKFIATCHHMPAERSIELAEEFTNPEHEGRMIVLLELCPECTPDFLPVQPDGPLSPEERRELVEQLKEIWRGGTRV